MSEDRGGIHPGQVQQAAAHPDYDHMQAFYLTYGHPAKTTSELHTAAGMTALAHEIRQYADKHGSLDGFKVSSASRRGSSGSSGGGDLMSLIHEAGFKGQAANIMYGIVMAESGGNARAHNTNAGTGDNSYGLAQINMLGSMGPARLREYGLSSANDLFDPLTNLKVAYKMSGGGTHFGDWSTYNSGAYQAHMGQSGAQVTNSGQGGGASGGGGNNANGTAPVDVTTTADSLRGVDGLGNLLASVPELKKLVDQAVANNWSSDKFQNQVENSKWYTQHSASARAAIIQQANDPSSFNETLSHIRNTVSNLSHQLGMPLDADQLAAIASSAMLSGNATDQQWLTQQISRKENYSKVTGATTLQGGMAATVQQLQALSSDYGYNWTPAQNAQHAQAILSGATTIDTYKQDLIQWAKSTFPSLSEQIAGGQTVKQLASPYINSMSNLLELDPGSLDVFTPAIRQAMQGVTDPTTKVRGATPLWQFEQQMRSDPRWQFTQNARDTMSTALVKVGADFGFGPQG